MTVLPLWLTLVLVALAGAVGALIRYGAGAVGAADPRHMRRRITAVNTVGAFFAGVVVAIDHLVATVITVGLFGSLTTFSLIAVWVAEDIRNRHPAGALRLVVSHVLLGVPAVLFGFLAGQILF